MKVMFKRFSKIANALLTSISIIVMLIALCTVDIDDLNLTPFVLLALAEAWLVYVFMKHEKGGDK